MQGAAMIGVLVFDDFQLLDATGPVAAFEIAYRVLRRPVEIRMLAAKAGAVRSTSGVEVNARSFRGAKPDLLLVAGGEGVRAAATCKATLAFVRGVANRQRRVASVCSGTYMLAEAGLLDGKRATTHWRQTRDFLQRYPKVRLEADRIYVQDGNIWSSAGITAGIDLALAMIADEFGEDIAHRTARQLVVYHRRSGGQSQFSALLELKSPSGRFKPLLTWARENLESDLTVERLAEQANMSPRHFSRSFTAETGISPSKAVERLRIEVARTRVQAGHEPIETIAQASGFGDTERMRRAFMRTFGHPPQSLRRAARVG
jgi:transcriptional regulator GlxA family with amidase domain